MIQFRFWGVPARRRRLLLEFLTRICHRIFQVVTARTAAARGPGWWRGYLQSKWNFRFLQYRWWAAWLFNDRLTRHTAEFQFRIVHTVYQYTFALWLSLATTWQRKKLNIHSVMRFPLAVVHSARFANHRRNHSMWGIVLSMKGK